MSVRLVYSPYPDDQVLKTKQFEYVLKLTNKHLKCQYFIIGKAFNKNLPNNLKSRICVSYLSTLSKAHEDVRPFYDGKFYFLV